jgi:hypothetical protein
MTRNVLLLVAVLMVIALVLPTPARACLIYIDFSVLADPSDPVYAGITADGSFSFDSSLIPSGGGSIYDPNGLGATSFSLDWTGHTWTTSDADLIGLTFSSDGALREWWAGGAPSGLNAVSCFTFPDFGVFGSGDFCYTTADSQHHGVFSGSFTSPGTVPEPWTLSLLTLGLLPLTMCRRRRR